MSEPFKSALYSAFERMLNESLSLVQPEKTWLHFRDWAAKKLMATEEMQIYMKSMGEKWPCPTDLPLVELGDGLVLPPRIYGFKAFIPKCPAVREDHENGILIHRIVPGAYLYYCPGINPKEAWYMPVEYPF